ncbi:MAG: TonB-dependent receptor [Chitinophagaceae bacterium]|nr:TonB-dependent receptor [Oligoflexus sp.]
MKLSSTPSRAIILSLPLLTFCLNASQGFAQASETANPEKVASPKAKKEPERIQVTGSRLKRSDVEGNSAVVTVDAEAIQKSGVSTVSEVLQNMALSIDGSYSAPRVDDPRGNVTSVNIRGVGASNTLVLLDGRRLPDEGGLGVVDLSQFPIAAIERIEVLKESASAIYGSDAAGGVINIITKKDFEGNAVFARIADPSGKGGLETGLSYVNGVQTDNARIMTSLSYRHVEPVYWRDRSWAKDGVSSYSVPGNIGLSTLAKNPDGSPAVNADGSPKTTTSYYTSANCPATQRLPDGECPYNYANAMAFSPESTQLGFLENLEYKFSDKLTVYSTLRAQRNANLWNMAPNAGAFVIPAATLAAKPDFNISGGTLAPGSDASLKYRALAWGNRTWEETNTILGLNVGLKGALDKSWEWNINFGRSESKKDTKSPHGFFLTTPVTNAVSNGSFDPFTTDFSSDNVHSIVTSSAVTPTVVNKTRMHTYDASLSGDLFEMAGGNAGLAVGVSRFDQFYSKNIDRNSEIGEAFGVLKNQSASGDRNVSAVYAELLMPVTKELEVQLAVRHDQYSDFGQTTNPKLNLKYKAFPGLLLRGNIGTGFKAPTLSQIYDAGTISYKNLVDTPNLATNPQRQDEIEIETYGSKSLKQETSLSWSAGFVADPFTNLSFTVDYWYLRINDVITPVDAQRALDAAARGTPLPGIQIIHVNNDPTGPLQTIRVPTANLGRSEDAGVDVLTQYRMNVDKLLLSFINDYGRKFYSKSIPFAGSPQHDYLGDRGHPAWRMVDTLTAGKDGHDVSLRNNFIPKQLKTPTPTAGGHLSSYSTYDVQYQWTHPWGGSVAIGALNVFNKEFPRDDNERTGDDQRVQELFSPNGRMVYLNVNQTF